MLCSKTIEHASIPSFTHGRARLGRDVPHRRARPRAHRPVPPHRLPLPRGDRDLRGAAARRRGPPRAAPRGPRPRAVGARHRRLRRLQPARLRRPGAHPPAGRRADRRHEPGAGRPHHLGAGHGTAAHRPALAHRARLPRRGDRHQPRRSLQAGERPVGARRARRRDRLGLLHARRAPLPGVLRAALHDADGDPRHGHGPRDHARPRGQRRHRDARARTTTPRSGGGCCTSRCPAAVVAVLAWNEGVRRLGAPNGSLFINLVPVVTFAIAIAQGYRPGTAELAGAGITVAALVGANLAGRGTVTARARARRARRRRGGAPAHDAPSA